MEYTGSILYFANNDYAFLNDIPNKENHKDRVLLMCQQCVEKYMKHMMRTQLDQVITDHNLSYMFNSLRKENDFLVKYKSLILNLRSIYYDRNYDSESYFEMDNEEFQQTLKESLELIDKLCQVTNNPK